MSGVCPWWSYLFLLSHFTLDNGCDVRQSSAILGLKLVSAGLLAADHQWRISADGCNLVVTIKLNFHNTLSIQLWRTFIWSICPLERVAHSRLKPKTLVVKNNKQIQPLVYFVQCQTFPSAKHYQPPFLIHFSPLPLTHQVLFQNLFAPDDRRVLQCIWRL